MTKRILIAFVVVLSLAVPGWAEDAEKSLSVRPFQLKHKEAEKAAAVIKSLMSAEGTVTLQPGSNTIVVTDRAENLRSIAAAIAQFDTEPKPVQLSIRLVNADRTAEPQPRMPQELSDVAPQLGMLRFNAFELVGSASVQGREGTPGVVDLEGGYRADFRFGEYDPATNTVRLNDFKLSKLEGADKNQLVQRLKTSLNLKPGNTLVLTVAKDSQSSRALMLVLSVAR